jgi:beta-xylosidase
MEKASKTSTKVIYMWVRIPHQQTQHSISLENKTDLTERAAEMEKASKTSTKVIYMWVRIPHQQTQHSISLENKTDLTERAAEMEKASKTSTKVIYMWVRIPHQQNPAQSVLAVRASCQEALPLEEGPLICPNCEEELYVGEDPSLTKPSTVCAGSAGILPGSSSIGRRTVCG